MLKAYTGTSFIKQVNCFIRQKAVTETGKEEVYSSTILEISFLNSMVIIKTSE